MALQKEDKHHMKQTITCIIITKNEELNIERSVQSAKKICDRVVVVDSGSTDNTVVIAQANGADVFVHEFITHGKQFNWALENTNIAADWILRLDADEVITDEAAQEILELVEKHASDDVNGIILRFKVFFLGKFLKHGGIYPFLKLCVFKNQFGYVIEEPMRDQTVITSGRSVYCKKDCLHYDFKDMTSWILKHNNYASLETNNVLLNQKKDNEEDLIKSVRKTKKMRDNFYYKLPMFFRAKLYYLYILIFKFAFLDGRPGLIHAYLRTMWYRYLVDTKLYEQRIKDKK